MSTIKMAACIVIYALTAAAAAIYLCSSPIAGGGVSVPQHSPNPY
jgi:hypothetical protein